MSQKNRICKNQSLIKFRKIKSKGTKFKKSRIKMESKYTVKKIKKIFTN